MDYCILTDDRLRCPQYRAHLFLRNPAEAEMSGSTFLAVVALAILIYWLLLCSTGEILMSANAICSLRFMSSS